MGSTLTINTDASFCDKTQAAGWAFTIVTDGIKVGRHGSFKIKPVDSNQAELMAIGNALHYLLNMNDQIYVRWFYINTDSKDSIEKIKAPRMPLEAEVNYLWKESIDKLRSNKNYFLSNVKSESDEKQKKAFNWCKYWSGREMKKQREEFLKHY